MGTWGAKLYENDLALDVKDRFDDLRKGKTVQQITNELIDEYFGLHLQIRNGIWAGYCQK